MTRLHWHRRIDFIFVGFLLASLVAGTAGLHYHGKRLESHALESRRQIAALDTRYTADLVTQTVNTVGLALRALLEAGYDGYSSREWESRLNDALRHAPHLRSLSLLDESGRVAVSTNPGNVGKMFDPASLAPKVEPWESVLQVGLAYGGRDLADGGSPVAEADTAPMTSYVPVMLALSKGEGARLALVAVLNTDFLLNRLTAREGMGFSWIDVVRYDGRLLFSTREAPRGPAVVEAGRALAKRWQAGQEIGGLTEDLGDEGRTITVFRTDRVLPLAVVTRVREAEAVADAREEGRGHLLVLTPILVFSLAVVLAAYLIFRRAMVRGLEDQALELGRLTNLIDALPAGVLLFGPDGRLLAGNRAWQDTARELALPFPADGPDLHYGALAEAIGGSPSLAAGIAAVLAGEREEYAVEGTMGGPAGERCFQFYVRPFLRDHWRGAVILQMDVTQRHLAEGRLRLLDTALAAAANAIVITDTDAVIEWVNPAFQALTGYSREEALGRRPKELVKSGLQPPELYRRLWETILAGRVWRGEVVNRRKDGTLYDESLTITPVKDRDGAVTHFVAVKEDISERKHREAELRRLATTDPLTGIANRRAFLLQLEGELDRFRRYGTPACLLMFDIDHFKRVNDIHGHAAGDVALVAFAGLVQAGLRSVDIFGRLGGEEFAALLVNTDAVGGWEMAQRLRETISRQPVAIEGGSIPLTVSIGLTLFSKGDAGIEVILARADEALYRAKAGGRDRVEKLVVEDGGLG